MILGSEDRPLEHHEDELLRRLDSRYDGKGYFVSQVFFIKDMDGEELTSAVFPGRDDASRGAVAYFSTEEMRRREFNESNRKFGVQVIYGRNDGTIGSEMLSLEGPGRE